MCCLGNHDTLWNGPTTIVLGVFCLTALIMVVGTVIYDLVWRRNERKRRATRERAPIDMRSGWIRHPTLDVTYRIGPDGRARTARQEGVASGARGAGVGVDRDRVG
jgi:hypothetical protein